MENNHNHYLYIPKNFEGVKDNRRLSYADFGSH